MKKKYIMYIIIWALLPSFIAITAKEALGNFAHRLAPIASFSFGQNIFAKNSFLLYPTMSQTSSSDSSSIELVVAALYGLSDSLSLYTGMPFILKEKSDFCTQRGIGNYFIQLEYAPLLKSGDNSSSMISVVTNVGLPTTHLSSTHDLLCTCSTESTSAPASFFVGTTANYISDNWYLYAATGVQAYAKKDHVRTGTQLLYQWGIGACIGQPWGLTTTAFIECNGIYSSRDSSDRIDTASTGGNILFVGPSLSLSGNHILISGGLQLPIVQRLNGMQPKTHFRSALLLQIQFH